MTEETFEKAKEIVKNLDAVSNSTLVISQYLSHDFNDNDCELTIRGVGSIRLDRQTAIKILEDERQKNHRVFSELHKELELL